MKQGEIDYVKNIGVAGAHHAYDKPFSDSLHHADDEGVAIASAWRALKPAAY